MSQLFKEDGAVVPVTFLTLTQEQDFDGLKEGEKVAVTGTVKGRGFQGGMKRHGFHGAKATHGVKHMHRKPGSIGATNAQRVFKGLRMAGHMGNNRHTVKNLIVAKVDKEHKEVALRGAVPGHRNGEVTISK